MISKQINIVTILELWWNGNTEKGGYLLFNFYSDHRLYLTLWFRMLLFKQCFYFGSCKLCFHVFSVSYWYRSFSNFLCTFWRVEYQELWSLHWFLLQIQILGPAHKRDGDKQKSAILCLFFCSRWIQAPLRRPVFEAVVSQHRICTLSSRFQSIIAFQTAVFFI